MNFYLLFEKDKNSEKCHVINLVIFHNIPKENIVYLQFNLFNIFSRNFLKRIYKFSLLPEIFELNKF